MHLEDFNLLLSVRALTTGPIQTNHIPRAHFEYLCPSLSSFPPLSLATALFIPYSLLLPVSVWGGGIVASSGPSDLTATLLDVILISDLRGCKLWLLF